MKYAESSWTAREAGLPARPAGAGVEPGCRLVEEQHQRIVDEGVGEAEALHPFRDGNGRAIRFYFNRLVQEAGYLLHWSKADPDRMLEASIAAIDGDYQALVDVLGEILEPCG